MASTVSALDTIIIALRGHLARSAYVVGTYGSAISASGAYILVELDQDPTLNIPKLADSLSVNRSSISRALRGLINAGLIRIDTTSANKVKGQRKKFIHTEAGRSYLKQRNAFVKEKTQELCALFSPPELKQFADYMVQFARGSTATPFAVAGTLHDHIVAAFSRLTNSHGIPQEDFLGSGEAAGTWVILSDIFYHGFHMSELAIRYGVEHVQLSQVVRRLQRRGLLALSTDEEDARMKAIKILPKGARLISRIETLAQERYDRDLKALTTKELLNFSYLLLKYVGVNAHASTITLPDSEVVVSLCTTKKDKELASYRAHQIEFISKAGIKKYPLSSTLYAEGNLIASLTKSGRLIGAIEFSTQKSGTYKIENAFSTHRLGSSLITQAAEAVKILKGNSVVLSSLAHLQGL